MAKISNTTKIIPILIYPSEKAIGVKVIDTNFREEIKKGNCKTTPLAVVNPAYRQVGLPTGRQALRRLSKNIFD